MHVALWTVRIPSDFCQRLTKQRVARVHREKQKEPAWINARKSRTLPTSDLDFHNSKLVFLPGVNTRERLSKNGENPPTRVSFATIICDITRAAGRNKDDVRGMVRIRTRFQCNLRSVV